MGLLDKAKEALGGGGGSSDDIADGFDEEFEEEEDEFEEEEDFEEEVREWETAYQFSDDILQQMGFDGIGEFIDKSMMYRIDQSPMYRDRIQSGLNTMNQVTHSMREMNEVRDELGGDGSVDYKEYAEQVRGANELINEMDRLEGKEEQMANEIIGIARDAVDAMGEGKTSTGNVNSSMGVREER